ncbi:MAG TPA: hypothetical protein VGX03_21630 [Candidatus Binatia bacterium]|jgi:hypothetical protein|nr:hypothetical protein [Candidatus Binatia bacterium]
MAMGLHWIVRAGVIVLTLLSSGPAWTADAFVRFFALQRVGQEITLTGRFQRFNYKRQFFERNDKTGEVRYFDYFGMTLTPTRILGSGAFSQEANKLDSVLFLYPDEELVKDLPEQGEDLWFTGTLIGYQYGISGITNSVFSGGAPYILLQRVSPQPPPEAPPSSSQSPTLKK